MKRNSLKIITYFLLAFNIIYLSAVKVPTEVSIRRKNTMKKTKLLSSSSEIPKISSATEKSERDGVYVTRERLSRWYRIYLTTTVSVVVLTVLLLFVGLSEANILSAPSIEKIASFFISSEFKDLSGDAPHHTSGDTSDFPTNIFDIMNGIMIPSKDTSDSDSIIVDDKNQPSQDKENNKTEQSSKGLYDFDYSKVPDGDTAVIPMMHLSKKH